MRVLPLLLATVLAAVGITALRPWPAARADEVTISGNNLRDGWDAGETTGSLTPATVRGGTFGELFTSGVDGQVYAQPLVLDAFHELVVAPASTSCSVPSTRRPAGRMRTSWR